MALSYSTQTSNEFLVTLTGVQDLRREIVADQELVASLREGLALKRKKLAAAMLWMTDAQKAELERATPLPDPDPEPEQEQEQANEVKVAADRINSIDDVFSASNKTFSLTNDEHTVEHSRRRNKSGLPTYNDVILRIANKAARGLTHQEFAEEIEKSELGEKFKTSTKAYYNTIVRLEKNGELKRHKGLIYSTIVFNKLSAEGVKFPEAEVRTSNVGIQIEELLKENPAGMTAAEITEALVKMPDMPRSLKEHKHYIYNVLAPLISRTSIRKDGERYFKA